MWMALGILIGIMASLLDYFAKYWHVTQCRCNRPLPWYIGNPHVCHLVMIIRALTYTAVAVNGIFMGDRVGSIIITVCSGFAWWIVKVHGSGKRKWPKKMAGIVRVNEHGRLVVANN